VDPSKNISAAKTLSDHTNDENMRRMKVNAQITAVTSIFEVFGNILQWTIWIFITKFAGYGSLIQSILLYFVILPYVFLMNTRQNKNRVVEDGWMNVLKNVFGTGYQHLALIGNNIKNQHRTKVKPFLPAPRKFRLMSRNVVEPCPQEMAIISGNSPSNHKNKKDIGIFTILNNKSFDDSNNENNGMLTINIPLDMQPCSSRNEDDYLVDNVRHKAANLQNKSETGDNVRHSMITDLLASVQNEDTYIDNFKWLIRFEDAVKRNNEGLGLFEERMITKGYCEKNTDQEWLHSYQRKANTKQIYLEIESSEPVIKNMKFVGDFQSRVYMRNEMIARLLKHYKDDDKYIYNDCVEMLIDMEEDFVA